MKDLIGNTLLKKAEVQARTHDDEGTTSNEVPYSITLITNENFQVLMLLYDSFMTDDS